MKHFFGLHEIVTVHQRLTWYRNEQNNKNIDVNEDLKDSMLNGSPRSGYAIRLVLVARKGSHRTRLLVVKVDTRRGLVVESSMKSDL